MIIIRQVTNDSPRVLVGVSVSLVQLIEFSAQSARRRCVALVSVRVGDWVDPSTHTGLSTVRCVALVSRRSDANGRRLKQLGYAGNTFVSSG